jgi:hypothetical protein
MAKEEATRTGDCRLWSPLDALRDAINDIETGDLRPKRLYVAVEDEDGKIKFFAAAGSKTELKELLKRHLARFAS